MKEYQSPQLLELRNGKVRSLNSSQAFVSIQANSNMRLVDHRDIVVAITDSHREQALIIEFDHSNHVSLLFGRYTTADNSFASLADFDKVSAELVTIADTLQSIVLND